MLLKHVELIWIYQYTVIVASSWLPSLPHCWWRTVKQVLNSFLFFFFYLGPVCFGLPKHSAFKAYCAYPKLSSAQINYPCVSYKETEVPEWGCAYIFWFNKRFPKNVVALSSQCLAAAGDMLHCFSLHLTESAGWISTKQAYSSQMFSHWSMSSENCNCHF
jgi:hypothetical protein